MSIKREHNGVNFHMLLMNHMNVKKFIKKLKEIVKHDKEMMIKNFGNEGDDGLILKGSIQAMEFVIRELKEVA